MTMSRSELGSFVQIPNVQAFLRVIRAGESSQKDDAYRMIVGGELFDDFSDHPRKAFKTSWGWSSAAGAYQAMCTVPGKVKTDTWGDFVRACGPSDFTPESQDIFAIWCLARRKALDDVVAGRFESAITKCNREWASFPGSPWGQPTLTMQKAMAVYEKYGGTYAPAPVSEAVPVSAPEDTPITNEPTKENTMPLPLPFVTAAIQGLAGLAPDLIRLFGNGPISERNAQAAEKVVQLAKEVTSTTSGEEAVAKLRADPEQAQKFRAAVTMNFDQWLGMITRFAELDEKSKGSARQFATDYAKGPRNWPLEIVTYSAIAIFAVAVLGIIVTWAATAILKVDAGIVAGFRDSSNIALQAAINAGMFAFGFWLGSSLGSLMKNPKPTETTGQK